MFTFRFPQFPALFGSAPFYRFLRVLILALVAAAAENLGLLELPELAYPIILAALVALEKYLRDKFAPA